MAAISIDDVDLCRVYVLHHPALVRFLARLTRCRSRAEDLAQAVWLKLLDSRMAGRWPAGGEPGLRAYLYTAARNAFIDEYARKHESVRTRSLTPADLETLVACASVRGDPSRDVERQQMVGLLGRAIESLPREQRVVLALWIEGTSIRDMAGHTAAPVDTVLSRKKYALRRVRRHLSACGVTAA